MAAAAAVLVLVRSPEAAGRSALDESAAGLLLRLFFGDGIFVRREGGAAGLGRV